MKQIVVRIDGIDTEYLSQLEYALAFASEDIVSYAIDPVTSVVSAEVQDSCDSSGATRKIEDLVARYRKRDFGLPRAVHFTQERELPNVNAWSDLLARRWVTPVGPGHVILRGPAAKLMSLVDRRVSQVFAREFDAKLEIYPSTILCESLHRVQHFTSFPEHVDFVAHLKQDLDVLNEFSDSCRETGWSSELHNGKMAQHTFAISPSCCYHAYEGREGWSTEGPGDAVTATIGCHRYEGVKHETLARLRSFTMREVIFIGTPSYVINCRKRAEELIVQWAREWEIACTFETANDMFFTADYSVKASFQRQQQAKKELLLQIPSDRKSLSVFSSNFHATTFGKAFNIRVGGRPATTGCIAWGYERWVYGIFSQFGPDVDKWPQRLRDEMSTHDEF